MPPRHGVQIEGLREFQQELRRLGDDLPRELGGANKQVADLVVSKATRRASSVSAGARKSAESLTAARMQRIAAIRLGGSRYPFAAGYEFGSVRYPQFPPFRGSGPTAGYWLYPTIRAEADEIAEVYLELIDAISRLAFPDN